MLVIEQAVLDQHADYLLMLIKGVNCEIELSLRNDVAGFLRQLVEGTGRAAVQLHCEEQEKLEPTVVTVRDRYRMAALVGILASGSDISEIADTSDAARYGDRAFDMRNERG